MKENYQITSRQHYPALDGLRGVAILLVLAYHCFNFIWPAKYGWIGVDLFFTLSGFLITEILLNSLNSKKYFRYFFISRLFRIYPTYILIWILSSILLKKAPEFSEQQNYYSGNLIHFILNLHNWYFILNENLPDYGLINHLWTVSLEIQFYFIWPFLIFIIKKQRTMILVILIALIFLISFRVLSWIYFGNTDKNFLTQSLTRVDGLFIGSIIAIWNFFRNSSLIVFYKYLTFITLTITLILMICTKIQIINLPYFRFIGYTTIPVCLGWLIIISIRKKNNTLKAFLENHYLKKVGKISFGLYMYHWPIFLLLRIYLTPQFQFLKEINNFFPELIIALITLILSLLISFVSFTFLERKMLELRNKIPL